jgi:hypothetical protein
LACAVRRIDRTSGATTDVVDPTLASAAAVQSAVGPTGSAVAPDGSVVVVSTQATGGGWQIGDLTTGTWLAVPELAHVGPVVWAADSAAAVFLADDRLWLYDRVGGAVHDLSDVLRIPRLRAMVEAP